MQASLFIEEAGGPRESIDSIYGELLEKASVMFPDRIFVFGAGNSDARLLLVGESPGPPDAVSGKPFTGPAGDMLRKMLRAIDLDPEECFFTNVVKYISQGEEITSKVIDFFAPYLLRETRAIEPKLVLSLGNLPTKAFLGKSRSISQVRGEFFDRDGIIIMPTFNPAYLLRDPTKKREAWEDLKKVREHLNSI